MSKRKHDTGGEARDRLQEADVFVTEYISELSFSAIIKQRFSDFQVFEIDEKGHEVHLTSLENNLKISKPPPEKIKDLDNIDVNEEPVKKLSYPITENDQWKQLTLLMKRKKKNEDIRIDVTGLDKQDRTSVHSSISEKYNGALCTSTVDEGKQKFIIISTNKNIDMRNFRPWPKETPQYLHFVMYKENLDTINAVRLLCKQLKMSQKSVSYAGTKDRRGVTTQRICIRQVTADRVFVFNQNNLWCGNFAHQDEPLKLGDLKGNHFVIALRNVESSSGNVQKTLESLKEKGFINYFGLQRFGVHSAAPTHEIGKCLLQNRCLEAINLILTAHPDGKDDDIREAIKVWKKNNDAKEAVKYLNRKFYNSAEALILKTLARQGNTAYVNALQQVPRNIILLYIHAFQSLVWNKIVSQRIKEYGMKVLAGDLVFTSDNEENTDLADSDIEIEQECSKSVRAISADEVDKVNIYDIVYPLPGYAIEYPKNEIADWYKKILAEYEVTDFNGRNKMFTASGAYRPMLVLPNDVTWKTVFYNNPSGDLIATDLQKLNNKNTVENLESGSYEAVILELSLPCCSYATMALREVTKADTSASYQASLTTSHLQDKKIRTDDSVSV